MPIVAHYNTSQLIYFLVAGAERQQSELAYNRVPMWEDDQVQLYFYKE